MRQGSVLLPQLTAALMSLAVAATCGAGGTVFFQIGYDALVDRLGEESVPTGLDVAVGQVEAGSSNYSPDQGHPEFAGKNFVELSGPATVSGHATSVAQRFYGNNQSIAPDTDQIFLWSAGGWIGSGYLNTGASGSVLPDDPPGGLRVINNSWVADFGVVSQNNEVLRRADYAALNDGVIVVNGVNNGGGSNQPLMSHMYNGIAVGVSDGEHVSGDTMSGIDGPGRLKPEIVAPAGATSFAAPIIAAGASLLLETAATDSSLASNENADRGDVIKAVLLGGANHREGWSNQAIDSGDDRGRTVHPIDNVLGVDLLDINASHLILTGGEFDGAAIFDSAPEISNAGWDLATVGQASSMYYRFTINQTADEVAILSTWHREVRVQFVVWEPFNFDLFLWRVEDDELVTLIGDAGVPYFSAGNITSESNVDNIEHLYIRDLEPAEYVLEVRRLDSTPGYASWDIATTWLFPEQLDPAGPADLDGDGSVGPSDLALLLGTWGPCDDPRTCPADLNGDGSVGPGDLAILLGSWG